MKSTAHNAIGIIDFLTDSWQSLQIGEQKSEVISEQVSSLYLY